jgi:hypothetical protein
MIRIEEQTLYEAFLVLLWARMNGVNVDKDSVSGIVKNTVERWSRGHSTGNITQDAALDLCNSVNIKEMFGNDSMGDLI